MVRRIVIVIAGLLVFASNPAFARSGSNTIYIPAIHVYSPLTRTLDEGPVAYYQTDDTLAIAAHRTHGPHLFYYINHLKVGDLIRVRGVNYYVKKTLVVKQTEVWILNYKGLVLTACSKTNGMPTDINYRFVVFAKVLPN